MVVINRLPPHKVRECTSTPHFTLIPNKNRHRLRILSVSGRYLFLFRYGSFLRYREVLLQSENFQKDISLI